MCCANDSIELEYSSQSFGVVDFLNYIVAAILLSVLRLHNRCKMWIMIAIIIINKWHWSLTDCNIFGDTLL